MKKDYTIVLVDDEEEVRKRIISKIPQDMGFEIIGQAANGYDAIDLIERLKPDVVITVCDAAAQEACPLYLGGAIKAHWGLSDPSHLDLPEQEKLQAFLSTVEHINKRLDALFALDTHHMSRPQLIAEINQISHL